MCGICGKYSRGGVTAESLKRMMKALVHRGPDDEGSYVQGPIGLGSTRLKIIDLEGGRMPIANEDQSIWIVFNGEIYNYRNLREELLSRGHQFRTETDTEVIVHLYEEMGEKCVARLNGMFAFAIWDAKKQQLFMARDRLGQKPLFYARQGDNLIFASEIKALLASGDIEPEMNLAAMHHYLSLRFIPPPLTMISGIHKLPPAHWLRFGNDGITICQYWDFSFGNKIRGSDAELEERLTTKLREVIASHLVSDVPVGAFLSGGMDSSMIVAMMTRDLTAPHKTFAVGVAEDDFNEIPFARQVAEHCRTDHCEAVVEVNLIRLLPEMIWHLDEPSDPIAACQYHAAALASQHTKVVLGGDGGDELFGGFDRYLGVQYIDRYRIIPAMLRNNIIEPALGCLSDGFGYKNVTQKLRWLQQLAHQPTLAEQYAEATCFFRYNHQQKGALYGSGMPLSIAETDASQVIVDAYRHAPADDPLDRMLYADYKTRLPEHSLMLTDRMSMAHSLELRSPFLDHELVEMMARYPVNQKIRGHQLKYSLRKISAGYLPESILKRPKHGFMLPIAYWFRGPLYSFLESRLMDSAFVQQDIFQQSEIQRLLVEHRAGKIDHHVRLWMLLNLDTWQRIFIDRQQPNDLAEDMEDTLNRRPARAEGVL